MLPTYIGAIDHVALFAPVYEAEHFAATYTALINSLPADCRVSIVAADDATDKIANWPLDASRLGNLSISPAGDLKLTAWARDPALALQSSGKPLLMVSPQLDRRDDLAAFRLLATWNHFSLHPTGIPFEAGNFLVAEDVVFVGADSIDSLPENVSIDQLIPTQYTVIEIGSTEVQTCQTAFDVKTGSETWQEIFHYHNRPGTRQPIFHIDMFVSLAGTDADGRPILLVGDPSLAAQILERPVHPRCLAAQFDAIADSLTARGMVVVRNPLPMIYMDDISTRTRTWFYASSNNVLVQQSAKAGNIVWQPEFGHDNWPELAHTDAANRKIWEDLGFEVRLIPDGQKLAENLGGLHCMTNVLKRS